MAPHRYCALGVEETRAFSMAATLAATKVTAKTAPFAWSAPSAGELSSAVATTTVQVAPTRPAVRNVALASEPIATSTNGTASSRITPSHSHKAASR